VQKARGVKISHTHEFWAVRGAHINFYSGVCATRQGTFTTSLRSSSSTLKVSHIFWAYVTERISTHSPNRKLKMQVSRAGRRLLCRWTAGCSLAHKNCTIALTHAARLAQLVCALAFNDFCVRTSMAGRRRSENSLLWHTYSKRHVKLCSGALYGIKSALGRVVCSRWKSRPDSYTRMVIVAQRNSGDALWSCFDPCDTPSAERMWMEQQIEDDELYFQIYFFQQAFLWQFYFEMILLWMIIGLHCLRFGNLIEPELKLNVWFDLILCKQFTNFNIHNVD
jgi:hypothetical protein